MGGDKIRVLITGCAGLIGANLSKFLLDKGYTVIGIDNLSGAYRENVDDRVIFYESDLGDHVSTADIFEKERPTHVYHLAAYAAEGLSPYIRRFNYLNNVICSVNVINACINTGVKKIIFTSSMAVYGVGTPPFTEEQPLTPEDPYGIAKYAIEMDLKLAHDHFSLAYSIVRPHNIVGIYQNIWDRYRNVIGIWIRQSMRGDPLTIFGDGTQIRAFSDIKFCMKPFEQLLYEHDGETFNIGADQEWTINDAAKVVQKVAAEFGNHVDIRWLEQRNEVHTAYCDHNKAKKLLNFVDNTVFETTVREMYKWAMSEPDRQVKSLKYEVEKNMYNFWAASPAE